MEENAVKKKSGVTDKGHNSQLEFLEEKQERQQREALPQAIKSQVETLEVKER